MWLAVYKYSISKYSTKEKFSIIYGRGKSELETERISLEGKNKDHYVFNKHSLKSPFKYS